jgi:hypothetical protein
MGPARLLSEPFGLTPVAGLASEPPALVAERLIGVPLAAELRERLELVTAPAELGVPV